MRLLIIFLLTFLTTAFASAQERPAADKDREALRPLSLWEKVKLGAAYYTNPNLMHQKDLKYGFDPKGFNNEKLRDLEKQQLVFCAMPTPSESKGVLFTPVACDKLASSGSGYVVSYQPRLLGKNANTVLLKTENYP